MPLALPKSIRRRGNQGGGAIVGFANLLLRLYEDEKPRAVLVGWDTLDAPTYRHHALEGYQGGRRFDAELIDQLEMLPEFVAACGFACAKAAGYEADDFLGSETAGVAGRDPDGGAVVHHFGDGSGEPPEDDDGEMRSPPPARVGTGRNAPGDPHDGVPLVEEGGGDGETGLARPRLGSVAFVDDDLQRANVVFHEFSRRRAPISSGVWSRMLRTSTWSPGGKGAPAWWKSHFTARG